MTTLINKVLKNKERHICTKFRSKQVFAYIKSAFEFSLVPHLDVDPLVQAQPDQIKGFLDRGRSSLQDVFKM